MARLLTIGIDGLDFDYVIDHLDVLPTFRSLSCRGCLKPLRSVFPPDSIPAWVTIFTGKSPTDHGIMDSVDYLEKNYRKFSVDSSAYAGNTFWDEVGRAGFKVCVINPFMAYPVWKVNGCMAAGPVFISGKNQFYPSALAEEYPECPPLGGIEDFPHECGLTDFVAKTHADARKLAGFAHRILETKDWNLGFVSFFTMDRMQHFLWRFCHKDDPTYPGRNLHENAIVDHYRLFDGLIGEFMTLLGKDDQIMVISDHGHGMRCTRTLNLNEFLRRKGYLQDGCGRWPILSRRYWVEKSKNELIAVLYKLRQEELIYKIGRVLPSRKRLKTGEHIIKRDCSLAWVPRFAGCGPYGAIELSKSLSGDDYERVCYAIIRDLEVLNRAHGGGLFKWIRPRKFLQGNGKSYEYPDILFELHAEYGVNWSLFVPLISTNYFHRRLSGGHKWDGVYASNGPEPQSDLQVSDIYAIVCRFFGLVK